MSTAPPEPPEVPPPAPAAGQAAAIAFLSDPRNWPEPAPKVERIETHGAVVFLAGALALKMKRAVGFAWMDFSTLEKRAAACAAEVALNRRTAPSIYLGVRWITRGPGGALALDGAGERVEPLVAMVRFPQSELLDRLAAAGELDTALIEQLADAVAAFHGAAERTPGSGGAERHRDVILTAHRQLGAYGAFLDPAKVDALRDGLLAALEAAGPLIDARRAAGFVRRCHGDLHLRNIVRLDGVPVPFDCIEFNPAFAEIDVLYDLAFLVMDLVRCGLDRLAAIVLSRYLAHTADLAGLGALPLFLASRAAIRAHVTALAAASVQDAADAAQKRREAATFLDLGRRFLEPGRPRLYAVGGLSGSGKTTLARALAPHLDVPPGAVVLRSDEIRKCLLGRPPSEPLGPAGYGAGVTARVYAALRERAAAALAAGRAVIVDAVHARAEERAAIRAVAVAARAPFTGLWLEAPAATLETRLDRRTGDASDADAAVLALQRRYQLGEIDWQRVDMGRELADVVAGLLARLGPAAV